MTAHDPIDRVAPSRRPDALTVMYQKWRSLLFLHWSVPPEDVARLLPPGLDLDLFEGRAYVGLVPFTMRDVRPKGLPAVPGISNFHETNVRTYVHVGGRDPGVWFFSLEAANRLAVLAARSLFHLPYFFARMRLMETTGVVAEGGTTYRYESTRLWPGPLPATSSIIATIPNTTPAPAAVDTLDHFLIERYLLYVSHRGRLIRGQVHHHPYLIQGAHLDSLDESLIAAAGLNRPAEVPLTHFSRGVDVEIFRPFPLPRS